MTLVTMVFQRPGNDEFRAIVKVMTMNLKATTARLMLEPCSGIPHRSGERMLPLPRPLARGSIAPVSVIGATLEIDRTIRIPGATASPAAATRKRA